MAKDIQVDRRTTASGGEENVMDAYLRGDAADRLALFLGYRDLRAAFRAVEDRSANDKASETPSQRRGDDPADRRKRHICRKQPRP